MISSPQTGPTKFKSVNHSCYAHKFFSVSKYEKKIKFDKICWGYRNGGSVSNEAAKVLNFPTARAILIKFLEWV